MFNDPKLPKEEWEVKVTLILMDLILEAFEWGNSKKVWKHYSRGMSLRPYLDRIYKLRDQ